MADRSAASLPLSEQMQLYKQVSLVQNRMWETRDRLDRIERRLRNTEEDCVELRRRTAKMNRYRQCSLTLGASAPPRRSAHSPLASRRRPRSAEKERRRSHSSARPGRDNAGKTPSSSRKRKRRSTSSDSDSSSTSSTSSSTSTSSSSSSSDSEDRSPPASRKKKKVITKAQRDESEERKAAAFIRGLTSRAMTTSR